MVERLREQGLPTAARVGLSHGARRPRGYRPDVLHDGGAGVRPIGGGRQQRWKVRYGCARGVSLLDTHGAVELLRLRADGAGAGARGVDPTSRGECRTRGEG